MPYSNVRAASLASVLFFALLAASARNIDEQMSSNPSHGQVSQGTALILGAAEGERRLHRPPPGALSNLTAPFILKVDKKNGGAPEFVMLTEDIPPGQAISPHRHPHSDEIIFIHEGTE